MNIAKPRNAVLGMAAFALGLLGTQPASAELTLVEEDGWKLTTDARLNVFVSFSAGSTIGREQPIPNTSTGLYWGAGTTDQEATENRLTATRIRNGFMPSILGFNGSKEVSENYKVSGRAALWMNISGGRNKNEPGPVDPRELWVQVEGPWGKLRGGSDLALFGRGGILVNYEISHNYGLGYPCLVNGAGGGACGHVAFGLPFPNFEAGIVYTTPNVGGLELSVGGYDPAINFFTDLKHAHYPRLEGELTWAYDDIVKVFANGHFQRMNGLADTTFPGTTIQTEENITADFWGVQGGGQVTLGPVMLGGAYFKGAGIVPFSHIDQGVVAVDNQGTLRESSGFFGMGSFTIEGPGTKFAAGYGQMDMDKTENDAEPLEGTTVTNPAIFRQNRGISLGLYQPAGPVYFALEYFRAQHEWHEAGFEREGRKDLINDPNGLDPNNLRVLDVITPKQTVNFINVGMTLTW